MSTHATSPAAVPGWGTLLQGRNLLLSLALSGGVVIHAVNLYLSTTILPSVVHDIGGIEYYAWNTTVYVVASIIGAAVAARMMVRRGPRAAYMLSATMFAIASVVCAMAVSMPMMLVGRTAQGLAGGVLVALPYALVRVVFEPPLCPRAIAMVSAMWGVSTLLGPALGGVFAEFGLWRAAFWSMLPVIALFTAMAVTVLPAHEASQARPVPLPWLQLVLLTLAVLAASIASVSPGAGALLAWLLLGAVLVVGFDRAQARARHRLLPRGSLRTDNPVGALYAILALLVVAVTCTEIFVPLFLQDLHGRPPLQAGYIAALMSIGWTTGSMISSGFVGRRRQQMLVASPLLVALATAALAILMPWPSSATALLWALGGVLVLAGLGVGIAFPHLSTRVLKVAPEEEAELAASAIMTIQLCATAFGAAIAGLVVNLAGQPALDGTGMDSMAASRWLFAVFTLAPALCLWMIWKRRQAL
ncbi:MAG TPA: MFS transporter [Rubrivivax sp.]|nr:MFS transporter [Rubrivivax sp.]